MHSRHKAMKNVQTSVKTISRRTPSLRKNHIVTNLVFSKAIEIYSKNIIYVN